MKRELENDTHVFYKDHDGRWCVGTIIDIMKKDDVTYYLTNTRYEGIRRDFVTLDEIHEMFDEDTLGDAVTIFLERMRTKYPLLAWRTYGGYMWTSNHIDIKEVN